MEYSRHAIILLPMLTQISVAETGISNSKGDDGNDEQLWTLTLIIIGVYSIWTSQSCMYGMTIQPKEIPAQDLESLYK